MYAIAAGAWLEERIRRVARGALIVVVLLGAALLLAACGAPEPDCAELDPDGDGFISPASVDYDNAECLITIVQGDCDTGNPDVHPYAEEVCGDGLDNNCDGAIDDVGVGEVAWYLDADTDGYGAGEPVVQCYAPEGHVALDGDCDDQDNTLSPGLPELCNGRDDDCSGVADDGMTAPPASMTDGVCFDAVMECAGAGGWLDPNYSQIPGYATDEWCDGLDNDCDGIVDPDSETLGEGPQCSVQGDCRTLQSARPILPSGIYWFDCDGPGTECFPTQVYCDFS